MGSISGLGRSPGGGIDNPFQCSCLEISTDRGALWTIVHREWGTTECSHMHMIYRARSYHLTINTTHKNPIQWVIILQLRDVEGLPHNQREAKTPRLAAFFASTSAESAPAEPGGRWSPVSRLGPRSSEVQLKPGLRWGLPAVEWWEDSQDLSRRQWRVINMCQILARSTFARL